MLASAVGPDYAFDLHTFWDAAADVLAGRSPYPPADPVLLAQGTGFVYPPGAAVLLAPLGLVPWPVVAALVSLGSLAAVAVALRLLGVQDWRVHGVALGCAAVEHGARLGALTPALLLAVAAAWRWRAHARTAGAALAVPITLKLFLLPVCVWLVAARRWGALLWTAAGCALAAVLGVDALTSYPRLLSALNVSQERNGYSLDAAAQALGVGPSPARLAGAAAGGAVLLWALWLGRRHPGREAQAFALAVLGALLLTPVLWLHYLVLLLAPLALLRPRLGPAWLIPPLLWLSPWEGHFGHPWRIAVGLGAVLLTLAVSARPTPPAGTPASPRT
jgi:hypothetical protein